MSGLPKLHVQIQNRTVCGLPIAPDGPKIRVLPPRQAQHATCKKCVAGLRTLAR